MKWQTTSLMLQRLQEGHSSLWDHFVLRFRGPLVNFSRQMGLNEDQAQDVAQSTLATFIQRFREGGYNREKGRLSSWLFGIAYNETLRHRRQIVRQPKQAPRLEGDRSFFAELPDEASARASWDGEWERHVLRACLKQVRSEVAPNTFEAFEQVALRGLPPERVAEMLGITRNAVFIAKHRVLKRLTELRREYEELDVIPGERGET